MNIRVLTSKIGASIREKGAASVTRAAGRYIWRKLRPASLDDFDRRHGTDTSGVLGLWENTAFSPNARFGLRYQASEEAELIEVASRLAMDPRNFTFIDIGCGKGRILLVAARLGFRRIVGVELAPELVDVAKKNLAKLAVTNALLIHGDAAEYVFPPGALLTYLYNPFGAPVMSQLLRNLEHRIEQGGTDEIYVAYKGLACRPLLDESRFLRRLNAPELKHIAIWKAMIPQPAPSAACPHRVLDRPHQTTERRNR
jgi:SAM-dependent methyltransferase